MSIYLPIQQFLLNRRRYKQISCVSHLLKFAQVIVIINLDEETLVLSFQSHDIITERDVIEEVVCEHPEK